MLRDLFCFNFKIPDAEAEDKPFVRDFTTSQAPVYHDRWEVKNFPLRIPSGKGWLSKREYNRELLQYKAQSYFQISMKTSDIL